jgi:hypothetical protein
MARCIDRLRLIPADGRRILLYLLAGWAMFAIIFTVALVDLGDECCFEDPGRASFITKVLLICLSYAQAPLVVYVLNMHHRVPLLINLPVSRWQINQHLLFNGVLLYACGLPLWGLIVWRLGKIGFPINIWPLVVTTLGLLAYLLHGMRVRPLWRAVVPAVYPLIVFPLHSENWIRGPLAAASSPWLALTMAVPILLAVPWILRRPIPDWARGSR